MNIVLSCYAKRGKCCYSLDKGGVSVDKNVFYVKKEEDATLKEYMLEAIIRGLKSARNVVEHEDLLLVNVQNSHLSNWLNGSKESKGYEEYLGVILDIIDTLDCRYRFVYNTPKKVKLLLEEEPEKERLEGIASIFEGLE